MATTYWYVEPVADITNEQLAAELARVGVSPAESECNITVDGKSFFVFAVPFKFVTMLERSDAHRKQFRVYVKEGGGTPRRWNFEGKRRRGARTARSVMQMRAELKRLKREQ